MRVRVGTDPHGEFESHQNANAAWGGSDIGWSFLQPKPGWRCYDRAKPALHVFDEINWVLLSDPKPDYLAINTPVDPNSRLSARSDSVLLDGESGSIRLSINRAAPENVGSILFQTQYVGGIEIGLNGASGFQFEQVWMDKTGMMRWQSISLPATSKFQRFKLREGNPYSTPTTPTKF